MLRSAKRNRDSRFSRRWTPGAETLEGRQLLSFMLQLLHASDMEAGVEATVDAPRFSGVLESLRSSMPDNTIVLASGDIYIPGPFFDAGGDPSLRDELGMEGRGRADIAMLNAMGFDAASLGNHEFDLGTAVMRSLIEQDGAYPGTQFALLSANLDFSPDANLAPLVSPPGLNVTDLSNRIAPSAIIQVDGQMVGLVGITPPQLESISSPGDVDAKPDDPDDLAALAVIVQAEIDALTAIGINKVIVVSQLQQIQNEIDLAALLEDVDIIVAGGSGTILADANDRLRPGDSADDVYPLLLDSKTGEPVALVNTDGNYRYVGRLVVSFGDDGIIDESSIDPAVSGAFATDDQGLADVGGTANPTVQAIADAIIPLLRDGNILASSTVFLNGERGPSATAPGGVRVEETNLGNLTADANLFVARQHDSSTAVSIKNGGGIRASIGRIDPVTGARLPTAANPALGKEEGDISQLDVQNTLLFNNRLSLLTLSAADLVSVLEHGVAATTPGATPGQFPQIGGMSFSFDPARTAGSRVRSAAILNDDGSIRDELVREGQLLGDPGREIRIVTLDFLANGGDSYPFPALAEDRVDLASVLTAPGLSTFAAPGSEQDAFAEFLLAEFDAAPFQTADTFIQSDQRIRNLGATVRLASTTINANQAQRSNLETVATTFSRQTNLSELITSGMIGEAVKLFGPSGQVALENSRFSLEPVTETLTIDLTIDGFGGSTHSLLEDGRYELLLDSSKIAATSDPTFRLDDDGSPDGLRRIRFFQLEGDFDGDAVVTIADRPFLTSHIGARANGLGGGPAVPTYIAAYDLDGDGVINIRDYVRFIRQLNKRV